MMNTLLKLLLAIPFVLGGFYLLGPRPKFEPVNGKIKPLNLSIDELDDFVATKEAKVSKIKAKNQAHIIWADSVRQTEWAVVYLHGFSASWMEGDPVHKAFAARYGCNLYLSRLADHGIDDKEFISECGHILDTYLNHD